MKNPGLWTFSLAFFLGPESECRAQSFWMPLSSNQPNEDELFVVNRNLTWQFCSRDIRIRDGTSYIPKNVQPAGERMNKLFLGDPSDVEELIEFSQQYSWKSQYSTSLIRRFLTELISSKNLIFDLHDQRGRVSTAVLIDKIHNPANDASLEILSLRSDADPTEVILDFITLAKERTPKNRAGFQVDFPENLPFTEDLLLNQGLRHHYDTFEMKRPDLNNLPPSNKINIVEAEVDDRDQVYQLLCESFAQNPEANIPEAETWKQGFLKSPKSHFYLWRNHGQLLGYAHLLLSEDGLSTEISTIGVLPHSRGKGIGQQLINHCLNKSCELGSKTCHLTVAATNIKALGIYTRSGFKTTARYRCYRMSLGG